MKKVDSTNGKAEFQHEVGGAVDLPKDYGMFICR